MKKSTIFLLVIICSIVSLVGCGGGDAGDSTEQDEVGANRVSYFVSLKDLSGNDIERTTAISPTVKLQFRISKSLLYADMYGTEYDMRQEFENAISVVDDNGSLVTGTYEWVTASRVLFTPDGLLNYGATYEVICDESVLPIPTEYFGQVYEYNNEISSFTTMQKGDVDGDGFADILAGHLDSASARLIYGSESGMSVATAGAYSSLGNGGKSVAHLGDVNADGYADFAISDPDYDGSGRVRVVIGNPSRHEISDYDNALYIEGDKAVASFGMKVALAGDVNGDGYDDIMVSEPDDADPCVYIYYGNSGLAPGNRYIPNITLCATIDQLQFGYAVAGGGDFNGDGYGDIAIGSNDTNLNEVYVFFGSATPATSLVHTDADLVIANSGAAGGHTGFGNELAIVGDVDGDGLDDLAIGEHIAGDAVYIVTGVQMVGDFDVSDAYATIEGAGNFFGSSISGAGDVDGDGLDDIVIGEYGYPLIGVNDRGRAYIYLGKNLGGVIAQGSADTIITGAADNDRLGLSVVGGNDVNVDGYDDVVIGVPKTWPDDGVAYVFQGSAGGIVDCDLGASCSASSALSYDYGSGFGILK